MDEFGTVDRERHRSERREENAKSRSRRGTKDLLGIRVKGDKAPNPSKQRDGSNQCTKRE